MNPSGRERRKLKRVMHRIPVRFEARGLRGQGHVKNLHREGLFIRSNLLPTTGAGVRLVLETLDGRKLEVQGTVRWTTDDVGPVPEGASGFGVLLESPGSDYLEFFESILFQ